MMSQVCVCICACGLAYVCVCVCVCDQPLIFHSLITSASSIRWDAYSMICSHIMLLQLDLPGYSACPAFCHAKIPELLLVMQALLFLRLLLSAVCHMRSALGRGQCLPSTAGRLVRNLQAVAAKWLLLAAAVCLSRHQCCHGLPCWGNFTCHTLFPIAMQCCSRTACRDGARAEQVDA